MAFPAIYGIRQAFLLLPVLSGANVQDALASGGKTLSNSRADELKDALNTAFLDYFRERLWQLWAEKPSPAAVAKQIKRIALSADRLLAQIAVSKENRKIPDPLRLILWRQAELHAKRTKAYRDLPPLEFVTVGTSDTKVMHLDYRGDEKVAECIDSLILLSQLLHQAHHYERKKVTSARARHLGR